MKDLITSAVLIFLFGLGGCFILGLSGVVYSYEQLTSNTIVLATQLQVDDGLKVNGKETNAYKYVKNLAANNVTLSDKVKEDADLNAPGVKINKVSTKNGHYYEFVLKQKVSFIMGIEIDMDKYGMTSLIYDDKKVDNGYEVGLPVVEKVTIQRYLNSTGSNKLTPIERAKNTELTTSDIGIPETIPTGKKWAGWFYDKELTKPFINKTVTTDMILYGKFDIQSFKINRYLNGGTLGTIEENFNYDVTITNSVLGTPTKTGYTLDGWYLDMDFKTKLPTAGVKVQNNQEFYAKWIPNKLTVTLHPNNNVDNVVTKNINYGELYDKNSVSFNKTGYTFIDWYTDVSFVNIYENKVINTSLDLYAKYEANTYLLNLDAQGGNISEMSKNVVFDSKIGTLPTPTKDGYTFDGWYTEKNGAGTKINSDSVYNTDSNTMVYANYKLKKVDLIIKNKNTDEILSKTSLNFAELINLKNYAITDANYIFKGFFKKSDDIFIQLGDESYNYSFDIREDTTIYADIIKNNFTITLHNLQPNGTETKELKNIKKGQNVNLENLIDTTGIYTFGGWSTVSNNNPVNTPFVYNYEEDKDLYGIWTNNHKVVERITVYSNTGEVIEKMEDINKKEGDLLTVSELGVPSRVGYAFNGWKIGTINKDGNVEFANFSDTNVVYNLSLYAQWTPITYTLTYKNILGAISDNPSTYNIETSTFTLTKPTKTGYTFRGWFDEIDSKHIEITKIEKGSTGNKNIYAIWEHNQYTISFNANGGSVSLSSKDGYYGNAYGYLPNATKIGHTFTGWYTSAIGGTKISATNIYNLTSNSTLYARYTENSLTVNYYGTGATSGTFEGNNITNLNGIIVTQNFPYSIISSAGLADSTNKNYINLIKNGYTTTNMWIGNGRKVDGYYDNVTGQQLADAFGLSLIDGNQTIDIVPEFILSKTYIMGNGVVPSFAGYNYRGAGAYSTNNTKFNFTSLLDISTNTYTYTGKLIYEDIITFEPNLALVNKISSNKTYTIENYSTKEQNFNIYYLTPAGMFSKRNEINIKIPARTSTSIPGKTTFTIPNITLSEKTLYIEMPLSNNYKIENIVIY